MTTCHVCNQVVVFAEQNQIVFCCRKCFDKFEEGARASMNQKVHHSRFHKSPLVYTVGERVEKLSDVCGFANKHSHKKGGMLEP